MDNAFSNWDTYSSFQQQVIKRALHQSSLGLCLRVWKEFSVIFINYLRNIPSILFLKMLAVFACKEYQADVENISHICLLFQLSGKSRTELFSLIRNNVVDVIKPEEVDDLIKEGIIEHKDDVIQAQLDGLTYLIHTCNS